MLGFNPMEFKIDPDDTEENGASSGDNISYAFEYRVEGYQTSYVLLHTFTDREGEQRPTDSVIKLRKVSVGGEDAPQIVRQTINQYFDDHMVAYTRDVIDFTENIGKALLSSAASGRPEAAKTSA